MTVVRPYPHTIARSSAEPQQEREADSSDNSDRNDRDQKNHRFPRSSQLRLSGGVLCVQYSADQLPGPQGLTDRICAEFPLRNNLNENNPQGRTKMSGRLLGSTAIAFASANLRKWLFPTRQKPTWRFLLASMRERLAAGWRATTSRLPTRSVPSSAKSCGAITSVRRRPF